MRSALLAGAVILLLTDFTHAAEQQTAHAIIPGFERFFNDEKSDAVRGGQMLLGELNCVACHKPDKDSAAFVWSKKAPILDSVGTRVRVDFLREFIANPHMARPGSTMPNLFASVPDKEREQQVEALVHFLSLTGGLVETAPQGQSVKSGEKLFHEVGCIACHDVQKGKGETFATSVPLSHLSKKFSIPGLGSFLENPLAARPSGRMPHLNLKPEEARDVAAYLLKDVQSATNLRFSYYEGTWDKLPDFSKLKPKQVGQTLGFDPVVGRANNFALRLEGEVAVEKEGQYRLYLKSDDGSRMFVDGTEVANNDGIHPPQEAIGRAFMTKGKHSLVVEYFQGGGEAVLQVEIEGSGLKRQPIDSILSTFAPRKDGAVAERKPTFTADPMLAEKGRELFGKLGCASCHQLGKTPPAKPNAEVLQPATLAKLKSSGGCVADKPIAGVPQFALNARQRTALAAAVESLRKPAAPPAGEELIARTMTTFNCYACHARGQIGGVEEIRNAHFKSNQQEMGDEGRIPPLLTGVGAKLKSEWLKDVFDKGSKERPYMFTRMPKFGMANVGQLLAALEATDVELPLPKIEITESDSKLKAHGRKLIGAQGMSCIKCHTWGKVPATGIQSISMTSMTKRLRQSWYETYLLEPQAFRPGTRMPQGWPGGQTFFPMVLNGSVPAQIRSTWAFLTDGEKGAIPLGLGRDPIELTAIAEPVIYRNFIDGAGPRAIGIGYPEKVNIAWDANDMRLALLWQGAFIDAARHWRDRGTGFQPPLGDNVVSFAKGASFARLETPDAAWPDRPAKEIGFQFKGYRLDEKRQPIFLYSFAEIQIEDAFAPKKAGDSANLIRTLTLTSPSNSTGVWFRAATGKLIEEAGQGWFKIDGDLKVKVEGRAVVRKSDKLHELVLPVTWQNGKAKIVLELGW